MKTTSDLCTEADRLIRELKPNFSGSVSVKREETLDTHGDEPRISWMIFLHEVGGRDRTECRLYKGATPEAALAELSREYAGVGFDPVLLGC